MWWRPRCAPMYAVTQTNWHVEPEAVPLLQELELREFRLGVISNAADEENTRTLIDKGGIRPYLEFIISSAAFGKRKPDPGIFRLALDHFGIPAERTVMVGDSYEADIVGAKQLGMHTIWIPATPRRRSSCRTWKQTWSSAACWTSPQSSHTEFGRTSTLAKACRSGIYFGFVSEEVTAMEIRVLD